MNNILRMNYGLEDSWVVSGNWVAGLVRVSEGSSFRRPFGRENVALGAAVLLVVASSGRGAMGRLAGFGWRPWLWQ